MKVYVVMLNWNDEDDSDVEYSIYDSYDKALKVFRENVEKQKQDTWIEQYVDENGNIDNEQCEVFENLNWAAKEENQYWSVTLIDWGIGTTVNLHIVEVK